MMLELSTRIVSSPTLYLVRDKHGVNNTTGDILCLLWMWWSSRPQEEIRAKKWRLAGKRDRVILLTMCSTISKISLTKTKQLILTIRFQLALLYCSNQISIYLDRHIYITNIFVILNIFMLEMNNKQHLDQKNSKSAILLINQHIFPITTNFERHCPDELEQRWADVSSGIELGHVVNKM